jgi:hypothetical protein
MKHLAYTLEIYMYSHYNMCSIPIYFCNIDIQHLQHLSNFWNILNCTFATCIEPRCGLSTVFIRAPAHRSRSRRRGQRASVRGTGFSLRWQRLSASSAQGERQSKSSIRSSGVSVRNRNRSSKLGGGARAARGTRAEGAGRAAEQGWAAGSTKGMDPEGLLG